MIDQNQQLALMNEQKRIANELVKSTLVPAHFKNPADAWFAIMYGGEMGFSPVYSLMNITVIKGKIFVAADALLAIAKAHPEYGGMELEYDDTKATCSMARKKANGVKDSAKTSFTIEQAKQAGLLTKDNWRQYPARMLRARVVSFVCRELFADVLASVYTTEEADEIAGEPRGKTSMEKVAEAVQGKPEPLTPEYEVMDSKPEPEIDFSATLKQINAVLESIKMRDSEKVTVKEEIKLAVQNKDGRHLLSLLELLTARKEQQDKEDAENAPKLLARALERAAKIVGRLKVSDTSKSELMTEVEAMTDPAQIDNWADEIKAKPPFEDVPEPEASKTVEAVIEAINSLLSYGYNKVHAANSIRKHFPEIGLAEESSDWQAAILAAKVDDAYLGKMAEYYTNAAKGAAKNPVPVKDDSAEIARLVAEVDRIMTDDAVEVTPEMERLFTESTVTSLQTLKAMVAAPAAQVKNINKLLKQKGLNLESFAPGYADASLLGAKLANEVEEKLKAESDF